jgi:molecular chaperone DnaK (HSP70)
LNSKTDDFLQDKITLIDILPLSIGVKTESDTFVPIIENGSYIPITKSKVFGINEDNEQFIDIEIFQGNKLTCCENYSVGKIEVDLLSKRKKNHVRIEIKFTIDVNLILTVNVKELRSSVEINSVFSKDTLSIDKGVLESLIKESNEFKTLDKNKEQEFLLQSKIYEKINILQVNNIDVTKLEQKLKNVTGTSELEYLLNTILEEYKDFLFETNSVATYEPKMYEEIQTTSEESVAFLLELISNVLESNINETNREYVLNIQDLLLNNRDHLLDLEKEKKVISEMYVSDEDSFNFLIDTLRTNIDLFNLNDERKDSLLNFIEEVTRSTIPFSDKIDKVNQFCEALI